ncbi:MAG: hypothetical protein K6F99_03690 [Lachnospiraceae bacterium]|nr:hypothetical protein [Lachnospiraceae bacterium]
MKEHKTAKNIRIAAFVMASMMLFTVLFSSLFIALETHHHCTGEHCPICESIEVCLHTLHTIGSLFIGGIISAVLYLITVFTGHLFKTYLLSETLVSNKVRMNN